MKIFLIVFPVVLGAIAAVIVVAIFALARL